jgi:hypothetical protein
MPSEKMLLSPAYGVRNVSQNSTAQRFFFPMESASRPNRRARVDSKPSANRGGQYYGALI